MATGARLVRWAVSLAGCRLRPVLSGRLSMKTFKEMERVEVKEPVLIFQEAEGRSAFQLGLNMLGIGLASAWGFMAFDSFDLLRKGPPQPVLTPGEEEMVEKVRESESRPRKLLRLLSEDLKYLTPTVMAAISLLCVVGCAFYPTRLIRTLRLMPNERVEMITYNFFGMTRTPRVLDLHLSRCSVRNSRTSDRSAVYIFVTGHRFFYAADLKRGSFPNPEYFDYMFALKR